MSHLSSSHKTIYVGYTLKYMFNFLLIFLTLRYCGLHLDKGPQYGVPFLLWGTEVTLPPKCQWNLRFFSIFIIRSIFTDMVPCRTNKRDEQLITPPDQYDLPLPWSLIKNSLLIIIILWMRRWPGLPVNDWAISSLYSSKLFEIKVKTGQIRQWQWTVE